MLGLIYYYFDIYLSQQEFCMETSYKLPTKLTAFCFIFLFKNFLQHN